MKYKVQEKYCLDALTICCKDSEPNRLFNLLKNSTKEIIKWDEEGKTPFFTFSGKDESFFAFDENDDDENEEEKVFEIEEEEFDDDDDDDRKGVRVYIGEPKRGKCRLLGKLCVHKTKKNIGGKYDGLSFFYISNSALYNGIAQKHVREVVQRLGLVFNNFTQITPCLTTTSNLKSRYHRLRKDESFEMYWFGDKVPDMDSELENVGYISGGNRRKIYKNKSITINMCEKRGRKANLGGQRFQLKFRCYDKKDQMRKVRYKMSYLLKYLDFKFPWLNLYRCEIDVFNKMFRILCSELGVQHDERLLDLIWEEEFQKKLLRQAIHHLFYWRKNGIVIDFL